MTLGNYISSWDKKIEIILIFLFCAHINLVTWKIEPHRSHLPKYFVQYAFWIKLPWICDFTAMKCPSFFHSQTGSWVGRHLREQIQQEESYFHLLGSDLMLETNVEEKGKKPNKNPSGRRGQEAAATQDKSPRQDLSNMTASNSVKLIKSASMPGKAKTHTTFQSTHWHHSSSLVTHPLPSPVSSSQSLITAMWGTRVLRPFSLPAGFPWWPHQPGAGYWRWAHGLYDANVH